MANGDHPSFSTEAINQALEAAQTHSSAMRATALTHDTPLDDGALEISAQCISVSVKNHQVCLNLPFGLGSKCLPVPGFIPNGTACQACLHICTKWGIPCGVEITVSAAGHQILKKHFGCNC